MASRQKPKQQLWPLGTKIRKYFDGHGDYDGEVKAFDNKTGLYSIEYSDGDTEQFDEREMKRYVLKTISFAAKPAAKPKAKSPKKAAAKKAPRKNDKTNDEDAAAAGDDTAKAASAAAAADQSDKEPDERNERMLRDIESMHQELEITGFVRGKTGQKRRKVPRDISKIRTQKRRALEKADAAELALLADDHEAGSSSDDDDLSSDDDDAGAGRKRRKKLRGSMAAFEADVLEGSMIFQSATARGKKGDDEGKEGDDDRADEDDDDDDGEGEEAADEDEDMSDSGTRTKNKSTRVAAKKPAARRKKGADARATSGKRSKKRRQMYRLRNFQSFKMAQRHGDALAAHAQGNYRLAIQKLKAVAQDAPSAPQVYSSLGMVYEDMLKESKQAYLEMKSSGEEAATALEEPEERDDPGEQDASEETKDESSKASPFIPNPFLREQCDLAKKAYGSHHASAVLCKKDFKNWVRAASSGLGIADLHEEISSLPGLSEELCSKHKAERLRWLDESLRDLQMADNLSPPGIDVPAKLAATHMELGNLSEALTILTDLKNRSGHEFLSSYKAWLLYSDLMLRFGHECSQWNQNVQTTENYMVRRWLRKYSTTFDWQERRMQALSLALGAAAGTKSADSFLDWIKTRAMTVNGDSEHGDLISEGQNRKNGLSQDSSKVNSAASTDSARRQFEQERSLLEKTHEREIDEFDRTTSEMELVADSDPAKNRALARESLLQSQQAAMSTLEKEYNRQGKSTDTNVDAGEARMVDKDRDILPMSASVGVVCSIASDLMKQLVRMELYTGARLVGEVVSRYMKERARLADRTLEARKRADEWQNRVINAPFLLDPYEENEDNPDEELLYLSDEETLVDAAGESTLLESLRRGALPPELRIISGLSMVGEGGRNFVASKYLQAIEDLEQESTDWLSDGDLEAQFSRQPRWFFFHRTMTEKLTKTVAYSLLADTLKKSNKNAEWALHFSPVFLDHLRALEEGGLVDELIKMNKSEMTANAIIRRSQILKVILGTCRLGLDATEEQQGVTLVLGKKSSDLDAASRMRIATTVLNTLTVATSLLWSVSRQGFLSQPCLEIVRMSGKCVRWLSANAAEDDSSLLELVRKSQTIVSHFVGGKQIPELGAVSDKDGRKSLLEATRFPLSVSWQPFHYRPLSDRTYNIAAACNVLPFSGWENEKFSSKLLKRRCGTDYFGLRVQGSKITGCLPSTLEDEMKLQWAIFENLEPELHKTDFEGKLTLVKESPWYKNDVEAKGGMPCVSSIAKYAEDDALSLFLGFSGLCLKVAGSGEANETSLRYKQLALSVLLPICRFCLDETLWVIPKPKPVTNIQPKPPQQALPQPREKAVPAPASVSKDRADDIQENGPEEAEEQNEKAENVVQETEPEEDQEQNRTTENEEGKEKEDAHTHNDASPEIDKEVNAEIDREVSEPTVDQEEPEPVTDEVTEAVENQEETEHSTYDKQDFEEWREEAGETIFEPLMEDFQQPRWNDNLDTLVLDQNVPIVGEELPPQQPLRRKRHRKVVRRHAEKTDNWHRPGSGIVKKFVPVKCSELNRLWHSGAVPSTEHDAAMATSLMRKVHSCMRDLHCCFTFSAAEKNCLAVSVALSDLAASPCCRNPFVCLQQASMYAAQAPKAGNSDLSFRRSIPSMYECTPHDALTILGRADCLHSVFFPEEAAFLCSFVANACALHRSQTSLDAWNDQWKVVGMYAYNVSVMIRGTVNTMMNQPRPKDFSNMWEPSVIKELENGRKDSRELLLSSTEESHTGVQGDLEENGNGGHEPGGAGSDQDLDDDEGNASVQSDDSNESGIEGNHNRAQDSFPGPAPPRFDGVAVYGV